MVAIHPTLSLFRMKRGGRVVMKNERVKNV